MTESKSPRPVLFVGSFPLETASEVFCAIGDTVGELASRIPDGETGPRNKWIVFQRDRLLKLDTLESQGSWRVGKELEYPLLVPKAGLACEDIHFGSLGYAEIAARSFAELSALKRQGRISSATRLQVSLPTPMAIIFCFFAPHVRRAMWPVYEQAMKDEIAAIAAVIPHDELAIQLDSPAELIGILENPENSKDWSCDELASGIARVLDAIPEAVEAGVHLCYGDVDGKHIVEPRDTALMVRFANSIIEQTRRDLTWVHMPVPSDRTDEAYFLPLRDLKLPPATTLFLGLVHASDGIPGAERRIRAARTAVGRFGIATECGLGRRPRDGLVELLKLHRQIAELH